MADAAALRPATLADAAALSGVIAAAYQPFLDSGIDLPPVAEGTEQDIKLHEVWIAERDSGIVGGIVFDLSDQAQIINLAVHPQAGGGGVGRMLMAKALSRAVEEGHAYVQLATHKDMEGTQAFYRKRGWSETGREGNKVYFSLNIGTKGANT